MRLSFLIISLFTILTGNLCAQTVIKGIVSDASGGNIPFAAVYLSKTTIGTMTNKDGAYTLIIPQEGEYELISSCIGYKPFSKSISAEGKAMTINIKLAENSILLDEITVKSKDRRRETNLTLFYKLFLGETINAQNCKILNPEDLYLYHDATTNLLKGYSLKSLRIENKGLGYIVVYDLTDFSYNQQNGILRFAGTNYFIPMEGNARTVKKWMRNRLAAYYGSRMHFMRSLYKDSLQTEKFQMYQVRLGTSKTDTLGIIPITEDSLKRGSSGKSITVYSSRPVIVTYYDTREELYTGIFGFQPQRLKSGIEFSKSLKVFANGYFPYPYDVTWLGEMSNERIADLLPYDFSVSGSPVQAAEPVIPTSSLEEYLDARQKASCRDQLFVHIDRNIYRPGDTLFFQAYIRDKFTGNLSSQSASLYAFLTDENNLIVDSSRFRIEYSTAAGWLTVPVKSAPGKYHYAAFTSLMQNNDPVEAFQQDLYVRELTGNPDQIGLTFMKDKYLPGDTIEAVLKIADQAGNPLRQQRYYSTLTAGATVATSKETETNIKGESLIRFVLADTLTTSPLLKIFTRKSSKEYAVRDFPVPYDDSNVELRFLPEGGTFVEGVRQRIGFCATNTAGEPVMIEGVLKNSMGTILDTISSGTFGPGSFVCTGRTGLSVLVTKGPGKGRAWPLPEPSITGISLKVVAHDTKSIAIEVQSNIYNGENVTVTGTLNFTRLFSHELKLSQKQRLVIDTGNLPAGVANITLFDKDLKPVAERLVYLNSDKHLEFNVETQRNVLPGQESEITVSVTDGEGNPAEGFFSIAVVDSARGIAPDLFAPGIEYTYNYHPSFPGNLPPKVLASGLENLTLTDRDDLLLVYGWSKITWELKKVKPDTTNLVNYDLMKLKVLYAGKKHIADRSLDLISLEDASRKHLITNELGEISLPLDSLSEITRSVILMPDTKSSNKAKGAMLSIPYNEQYIKSNKLHLNQPVISTKTFRIRQPDQPVAMEENTIEIPEITVVGHQNAKVYKDEYERMYQADHVKSLDYEQLWSSTTLETAIRKLAFPYKITPDNIYLHSTRTILKGPVPALIVLDGMPLYQQGWPMVNTIPPGEITSLTILESKQGFVRYGEAAQGGVIFVNTRSTNPDLVRIRTKWNAQNSNDKMMIPITLYQPHVEFYNPTSMQLDSNPLLQSRATIYWQSEVYFGGSNPVKIKYNNLKHPGPVSVIINGASVNNLVGTGRAGYLVQ